METVAFALRELQAFLHAGGTVLYAVTALSFLMWALVFDRLWYLRIVLPHDVAATVAVWEACNERRSWHARQVRRALLARLDARVQRNLALIRACVALCPLLGLLGTVTGMLLVFEALSLGAGDTHALADGVARATIPTMAGMVAAISGVLASAWVARLARRELALAEDRLTADH